MALALRQLNPIHNRSHIVVFFSFLQDGSIPKLIWIVNTKLGIFFQWKVFCQILSLHFQNGKRLLSQLIFTCSKSIIETLKKMWNMFRVVYNKNTRTSLLAGLVTIHKKRDRNVWETIDLSNFSISVAKFLISLNLMKFFRFLIRNNLVPSKQSGFKPGDFFII